VATERLLPKRRVADDRWLQVANLDSKTLLLLPDESALKAGASSRSTGRVAPRKAWWKPGVSGL